MVVVDGDVIVDHSPPFILNLKWPLRVAVGTTVQSWCALVAHGKRLGC